MRGAFLGKPFAVRAKQAVVTRFLVAQLDHVDSARERRAGGLDARRLDHEVEAGAPKPLAAIH